MGGVAGADNGDGHGIGGKEMSFDEEDAGRIGQFAKQAGVGIVGIGKDLHTGGPAQIDFRFNVDVFTRGLDGAAEFWADTFHCAQVVVGGGENCFGRAELLKKFLPDARTYAGD